MLDVAGTGAELDAFLNANVPSSLARVLHAIAGGSLAVAYRIRRGVLAGAMDAEVGPAHDGVAQKALDVFADDAFVNWLKRAGVRAMLSEERQDPVVLDPDGALLVAIDPLDGSNNIDANGSMGTFFSVLDAPRQFFPALAFPTAGSEAAGGWICALRAACRFCLHLRRRRSHGRARAGRKPVSHDADGRAYSFGNTRIRNQRVELPSLAGAGSRLYRGSASKARKGRADATSTCAGPARRWPKSTESSFAAASIFIRKIRARAMSAGACGSSMRRAPSPSSSNRPAARRSTALIASSTSTPASLHARTPLIFGSKDKVERVARYYAEGSDSRIAPLFARRGLLRH